MKTTLEKIITHVGNHGKDSARKQWSNAWVIAACKVMALRGIEVPRIVERTVERHVRRDDVYNEGGMYFY